MSKFELKAFEKIISSPNLPSFEREWGSAVHAVEDSGWTHIETEGATDIYLSPNKRRVARINHGKDYAFCIYADLCQQMPHNPYFQNVHHQYLLNNGTHITILDRLIPADYEQEKHKKSKVKNLRDLGLFMNDGFKHPELEDKFMNDADFKEAVRILWHTIDIHYGTSTEIIPDLDLHSKNLMLRPMKDKSFEPVMSDPLGTAGDPDSDLEQYLNPWDVRLRRKLGMVDPPYFKSLSRMLPDTNKWHWDYFIK